jgi:hypothetical protein
VCVCVCVQNRFRRITRLRLVLPCTARPVSRNRVPGVWGQVRSSISRVWTRRGEILGHDFTSTLYTIIQLNMQNKQNETRRQQQKNRLADGGWVQTNLVRLGPRPEGWEATTQAISPPALYTWPVSKVPPPERRGNPPSSDSMRHCLFVMQTAKWLGSTAGDTLAVVQSDHMLSRTLAKSSYAGVLKTLWDGDMVTLGKEWPWAFGPKSGSNAFYQKDYGTHTQTHKHTNTQTHKHTNTQTYTHTAPGRWEEAENKSKFWEGDQPTVKSVEAAVGRISV